MKAVEFPGDRIDSTWTDSHVMANVTAISDGPLAEAAHRIDEGHYPLEILGSLGTAGAFGAHLERGGRRVGLALDAMRAVSRRCGSTGFLTWAHDVCGLYMEQSGNPALTGELLDDHTMGRTFGGTALSNPMKAIAGIEKILLRAVKVPGGYQVSGALPWVSHIAPGHYCGAMAGVFRDDGSVSHEIMFLLKLTPEVVLRQCPEFSGMEGTSTWGVRLDNYFVGDAAMIADPARPLIAKIRAVFVLLQAGMAMGIAQGSIDSIREVEPVLGHVNQFLEDGPAELQAEYDELWSRVAKLAQTPYDGSKDYLLHVLDARVQGAQLALRAANSALMHQGARGYLMSAAPQRRIREAQFVAIVTPAIKHLRWEMARLSKEEVPE
ncbi:acyl-CoA/acyl-ACP dehydrogenase [Pandoraea sp. XJJ-1]|uniref:acyl-CoA dehydrogenase family protein n=1 Tax=unclassified Pandoraea TaxID=2624094 RepID=UPI0003482E11|nr:MULTISPECIES: acyl-CoA dehydrogenase family protein [unclassified Pandoraea]WAL84237.1 acyl-CoA/acyl-ACP dehydrogenase [Pandoraea sp. XJJ-1]BDD95014.1 acyl-CoA dehydrogenase [Pandoraea sp. NE5]